MKITIEGTEQEIKNTLSTIGSSQEDNIKINLQLFEQKNSNQDFQKILQKFHQQTLSRTGGLKD